MRMRIQDWLQDALAELRRPFRASVALGFAGAVAVSGCGISTQQELEMGAQYAAQINRELPIVQDAQLHRYINDLGNELARHAGRGIQYRFYIVNADMVNAFAVPGGYIYLNRGLIQRASNMSEVAGVLAHEIAHVEHRHGVQQMERMQTANIGLTAAYVLLGRAPGGVEQAAIDVGGTLVFSRYSREAELEADASAIPMLLAARIHPMGLATMFEKLLEDQQRQPSRVEQWFATHPTTTERVTQVRGMVNQLPAAQLRNARTNTTAFQNFQQRLRGYRAPPAEFRR
jgi:beta-barrel assembly-enhancing protease